VRRAWKCIAISLYVSLEELILCSDVLPCLDRELTTPTVVTTPRNTIKPTRMKAAINWLAMAEILSQFFQA
jgi:hypothetical protein